MKKHILLLALFLFGCVSYGFAADEVELDEAAIAELLGDDEKLIAAAENLGPSASGLQSDSPNPEGEGLVDPRVLRDFVESKGLIKCRQKEGALTIAGDVRARWVSGSETVEGIRRRGSGTPIAMNRYKSEVNLLLDYVAPRSWLSTKLKFFDYLGRDGGTVARVELERAFIGYDVYHVKDTDFYIELGRSRLDYIFDSKVEFGSVFDGIHFFYTQKWPCVGTYTIHGGPFIIDSFTNHYGWVVETFLNKIYGSGFSLKYSVIDWFRSAPTLDYGNRIGAGKTLWHNNPRYRFIISQLQVGYEKKIDFLGCKTIFLYGAVLHNFAARSVRQTCFSKSNNAFYAGFTLGKLCKACDWSIDINYQYVEAQSVPDFDLNGIGHGNADNGFLADSILSDLAASRVRLFTNYRGLEINGLYAMTDAFSIRTRAQFARPVNRCIGGDFRYKSFEMSVIYAF